MFLFFFLKKLFVLKYSCFTVLYQFLLCVIMTQSYIYIYVYIYAHTFFSHTIFLLVLSRELGYLDIVPYAVQWTSLLIHSTYNSLHLLTPNSPSTPLPPLSLGNHKSVLYVWESNLKRYMHPYVHGSTIHNSQDMETT